MLELSPDRGLIFRICHIANIPWTLAHGLRCRNADLLDPDFRPIGNPELIAKRHQRAVPVPPGGTLSDYVPFYFTPHSPMLLNIKTGYHGVPVVPMPEIVMLVARLPELVSSGMQCVVADRHAYLQTAQFTPGVQGLATVDWETIRSRNFKRDPDDPGRFERYQAEALVYGGLQASQLAGIVCHGEAQREQLQDVVDHHGLSLKVISRPTWYF